MLWRMGRRSLAAVGLTLAAALVAAACGDGGDTQPGAQPQATGTGDRNLQGVCPPKIVLQTNWYPMAETAAAWSLAGPGRKVDRGKKSITGPLVSHGVDTGLDIEVRAGGAAIGFQRVPPLMYLDKSITLGYVLTDETIGMSANQPTLAVAAMLDRDPMAFIWDPATYPEFTTIKDIGQTDVTVVTYPGVYIDYLVETDILRKSQIDASYDGSPSRFVADGGKTVVLGYATNEPWTYEHEVKAWGKPVKYALLSDTGYANYAATIAIRPADKTTLTPCLTKLVPILQQAQVDFLTEPGPTIDLVVELAKEFGFIYSQAHAENGTRTMVSGGLAGNGTDRTLGNFDTARLQKMIDIVTPITKAQGKAVKQGLRPADIATNEFLDPAIGLPGAPHQRRPADPVRVPRRLQRRVPGAKFTDD
jgi:hypothetical protein